MPKARIMNCVIRYETADIRSFSSKHSQEFDLVVVSEVLEHVSDKEYFLKSCANCLMVSGTVLFTTFYSKSAL